MPLKTVAKLGRTGGAIAWSMNLRFRQVALQNLAAAFPDKDRIEISRIGRENMLRIGENYASAVKTAAMPLSELNKVCQVVGLEKLPDLNNANGPRNCVVAIGHFGNFELYTMIGRLLSGAKGATTYRALKQQRLTKLMQQLRQRSGCLFFERRTDADTLKKSLNDGGILLGLLSDQHVSGGVWGPFLGRPCCTTPAPAVIALRYQAPLFSAICYRTSLAHWRIEIGDEIPTHNGGEPRKIADITADINKAFEQGVRRDPANWFWVHNRWKPRSKAKETPSAPAVDPEKGLASPSI